MKYIINFFLCVFVASWLFNLNAAEYYIDFDNGLDSNTGTINFPWQDAPGDPNFTGNTALQPGDSVLFKGGVVYRGQIVIQHDGAVNNPITYKGDGWGADKAIIDGSEVVTAQWTQCTSAADAGGNPNWPNIWYADLPAVYSAHTANLQENDEYIYLARYPSPPDPFFFDNISVYLTPQSIGNGPGNSHTYIIDSRFAFLGGQDLVGKYVSLWEGNNVTRHHLITGYIPAENKITFEYVNKYYTGGDAKYALANYVGLIDAPGECCYDETGIHRTYIWPRYGNPNNNEITISVRGFGIDFKRRNHLIIEGFQVQKHSGQDQIYDWNRMGIGVGTVGPPGGGDSSYVTIRNNYITRNRHWQYAGSGGIYLTDGLHCVIEDNIIERNFSHLGIFVYSNCQYCIIRNNRIIKPGSHGIWLFKVNMCAVINNELTEVKGIHANGMTCFENQDIFYFGNKVFSPNFVFAMNDCDRITFVNNIFHGMNGSRVMTNMHRDNDIKIYNNLFLCSPAKVGIYITNDGLTGSFDIRNNIIDGILSDNHGPSIYTHSHNIFTGLSWNQDAGHNFTLDGTESVQTDLSKIFLDPANFDFKLLAASQAIDAGSDISGNLPAPNQFPYIDFSLDAEGNSRPEGASWDIGPYEFVPDPNALVPVITVDNDSGFSPLDVAFDGLKSYTGSGTITQYDWDFGDGTTASGVSVNHTYSEGTYQASLTIINSLNNSATAYKTITVLPSVLPGLLVYLTLDDNAQDISGRNNHAVWAGTASYGPGKIGNAALFDGTSTGSYLTINDDSSLDGMDELTIALWVKKNTANVAETLVLKHVVYRIGTLENGLNGYLFNEANEMNSFSVNGTNNDTDWHHYAITYDGSMILIYLDGVQVGSKAMSGGLAINTGRDIEIGKNPWGNCFNGLIDELQLYNKALSAQEIQDLINHKPVINPINPITVHEGELIEFDITAFDADGDPVTITPTDHYIWQTDFDDAGNYTVTFIANDGTEDSVPVTVGIDVIDVSTDLNLDDKGWEKE